jgi:hypothetical protein
MRARPRGLSSSSTTALNLRKIAEYFSPRSADPAAVAASRPRIRFKDSGAHRAAQETRASAFPASTGCESYSPSGASGSVVRMGSPRCADLRFQQGRRIRGWQEWPPFSADNRGRRFPFALLQTYYAPEVASLASAKAQNCSAARALRFGFGGDPRTEIDESPSRRVAVAVPAAARRSRRRRLPAGSVHDRPVDHRHRRDLPIAPVVEVELAVALALEFAPAAVLLDRRAESLEPFLAVAPAHVVVRDMRQGLGKTKSRVAISSRSSRTWSSGSVSGSAIGLKQFIGIIRWCEARFTSAAAETYRNR